MINNIISWQHGLAVEGTWGWFWVLVVNQVDVPEILFFNVIYFILIWTILVLWLGGGPLGEIPVVQSIRGWDTNVYLYFRIIQNCKTIEVLTCFQQICPVYHAFYVVLRLVLTAFAYYIHFVWTKLKITEFNFHESKLMFHNTQRVITLQLEEPEEEDQRKFGQ